MTAVLAMVAMMIPGALPATARQERRAAPVFLITYLAVWALVAAVVNAVYRMPSAGVSAAVVIGAGLYELTPVKRQFRRRCQEQMHSGFEFGLCCLGSSIGLMAVLVAVNMMSIPWMITIAAVIAVQKIFREKTAVDVALALAMVALGALIATGGMQ